MLHRVLQVSDVLDALERFTNRCAIPAPITRNRPTVHGKSCDPMLHYDVPDRRASLCVSLCEHMSMARTCMHAHMVAHVHTRVHAKEDTYTSAHTARTRNIRIRTCATPESTNTRHSTFQNRQPPPKAPCLVSIYHNLPTKTGLHRHISGCPSRHALADCT